MRTSPAVAVGQCARVQGRAEQHGPGAGHSAQPEQRGWRWYKVCPVGMSHLPGAEGTGTFLTSCGFLTGWCIPLEQGPGSGEGLGQGVAWPPTHPLPVSVLGCQQSPPVLPVLPGAWSPAVALTYRRGSLSAWAEASGR